MRNALVLAGLLAVLVPSGTASAHGHGYAYGDIIMVPRIEVDADDPDRLARCDYLVRGNDSRLWLGYVLEIPAPFNDGAHAFTLVDGQMGLTIGGDFDITFASELGTCSAPLATGTRFHNLGDERGIVPSGTRYAIVTLRSEETPGATFFLQIPAATD